MRDTYAIYARKFFTPCVPKFFIGEGSFCYKLTKIFILDIIDIMRTALIINNLGNGFQG